ncbi:exonuclease 1, partial [Tanacetum coccineum]
RKRKALEDARKLDKAGEESNAKRKYSETLAITREDGYKLIKKLKARNFEFIASPIKADTQIAYLSNKDIVDFVVAEDSDFIVYGCEHILFKLQYTRS